MSEQAIMASDVLTSDDIAFLIALANELKTQDRAYTAKPVIYQIMEKKKEVGYEEDFADGMAVGIGDDSAEFYDNDVEGAKQFLVENYGFKDAAALAELKTLEDVADLCACLDVRAVYTGYRDTETFKGFFLTKAALKRHVEANHYHYTNPVSYAQYAGFRNPELERLLNIIEKFATVEEKS